MQHVVITGASRGIGLGLADSFLSLGCRVTICARSAEGVSRAVMELGQRYESGRIAGQACDVADADAVHSLWDFASNLAPIDMWVNNAGVSGPQVSFTEIGVQEYQRVVDINLVGMLHGCRVAARGMAEQGFGHIYNMEGLGSDGRIVDGLSVYGTTKSGLRYFTRALARELRGTPVAVSAISPGMVVTDLLLGELGKDQERFEKGRWIFNILADRVETVTPWLATRMLANRKSGARIAWLTTGKILLRFLLSPFSKRELIPPQP